MKKINLSWLAGIFDGEGCLTCSKFKHGYVMRLIITNTDKDLLWKARNICEELTENQAYCRIKNKNCGEFYFRRQNDILKILEAIIPYLTAKRTKAKLFIETIKARQEDEAYHKINTRWMMEALTR